MNSKKDDVKYDPQTKEKNSEFLLHFIYKNSFNIMYRRKTFFIQYNAIPINMNTFNYGRGTLLTYSLHSL